jgi:hypothetical protein
MSDSSRAPLDLFLSPRSTGPIRRPPAELLERYQQAIQEILEWLRASRDDDSERASHHTPSADDLLSPGFHVRLVGIGGAGQALQASLAAHLELMAHSERSTRDAVRLIFDRRMAAELVSKVATQSPTRSAAPAAVTFITESLDPYESDFLHSALASHLPALVRAARQDNAQQRMQQLLQAVAPTDPMAEIQLRMAEDTASLRAEFFELVTALTSVQVAERAGFKKNAYQTVHRWRSAKKIFAVKHGGQDLYPDFQFGFEGRPLPVMAEILAWFAKVESRSDWDNAFWFIGANGWLGGKPPYQMLKDEPAKVVKAAKQEVLPDVE